MREYVIREGSMYAGTHNVYENADECRSLLKNPDLIIHKWAVDDYKQYEIGHYVQAEDGYVVQILVIREMKSKKQRKGRTVFIRFPMGTFPVYEKADGTVNYPRFYAMFTTGDKASAGGRSRTNFTGSADEAKKRFANLIVEGFDHKDAYRTAFGYYRILTPSQIEGKITKLFRDKVVIEELRELLQPYRDSIKNKFPDKLLLKHLNELLTNCKKGTVQHRENLRFIMTLRGNLPPKK
jgi:hypothetical protein